MYPEGDILIQHQGMTFANSPLFKAFENEIVHAFSGRKGGLSDGQKKLLNVGLTVGDSLANVYANLLKITGQLGIKGYKIAFSRQVHGDRVYLVEKGLELSKSTLEKGCLKGYDALITNRRNILLMTFHADCVPVYIYDPVNKAAGLAHSGWRGTVKNIACRTVERMEKEFGTQRNKVLVAIGPSIQKCCFETGDDVYEEFEKILPCTSEYCTQKKNGKYLIDLQFAISRSLLNLGLNSDNIWISRICTSCSSETFFSYRVSKGLKGLQAAFMMMK